MRCGRGEVRCGWGVRGWGGVSVGEVGCVDRVGWGGMRCAWEVSCEGV